MDTDRKLDIKWKYIQLFYTLNTVRNKNGTQTLFFYQNQKLEYI